MAIHVRALHRRRLRLAGLLLASLVLATACSAGGGTATGAGSYPGWPVGPISGARLLPVILNSAGELAVGPSCFLFTLLDSATNAPAARPSITTRLAFYDLARAAYAVVQTGERRFYGCFFLRKGVIPPDP